MADEIPKILHDINNPINAALGYAVVKVDAVQWTGVASVAGILAVSAIAGFFLRRSGK